VEGGAAGECQQVHLLEIAVFVQLRVPAGEQRNRLRRQDGIGLNLEPVALGDVDGSGRFEIRSLGVDVPIDLEVLPAAGEVPSPGLDERAALDVHHLCHQTDVALLGGDVSRDGELSGSGEDDGWVDQLEPTQDHRALFRADVPVDCDRPAIDGDGARAVGGDGGLGVQVSQTARRDQHRARPGVVVARRSAGVDAAEDPDVAELVHQALVLGPGIGAYQIHVATLGLDDGARSQSDVDALGPEAAPTGRDEDIVGDVHVAPLEVLVVLVLLRSLVQLVLNEGGDPLFAGHQRVVVGEEPDVEGELFRLVLDVGVRADVDVVGGVQEEGGDVVDLHHVRDHDGRLDVDVAHRASLLQEAIGGDDHAGSIAQGLHDGVVGDRGLVLAGGLEEGCVVLFLRCGAVDVVETAGSVGVFDDPDVHRVDQPGAAPTLGGAGIRRPGELDVLQARGLDEAAVAAPVPAAGAEPAVDRCHPVGPDHDLSAVPLAPGVGADLAFVVHEAAPGAPRSSLAAHVSAHPHPAAALAAGGVELRAVQGDPVAQHVDLAAALARPQVGRIEVAQRDLPGADLPLVADRDPHGVSRGQPGPAAARVDAAAVLHTGLIIDGLAAFELDQHVAVVLAQPGLAARHHQDAAVGREDLAVVGHPAAQQRDLVAADLAPVLDRAPESPEAVAAGGEVGIREVARCGHQPPHVHHRLAGEGDAEGIHDVYLAAGPERTLDLRGVAVGHPVQHPGLLVRLDELHPLAATDVELVPLDDGAVAHFDPGLVALARDPGHTGDHPLARRGRQDRRDQQQARQQQGEQVKEGAPVFSSAHGLTRSSQ
jgi:hypothetical protein